jgi:hypothetical protein
MYGVVGEKRPIFLESDAFLYNLDYPTLRCFKILPLAISCIIIPLGGIIMYGLVEGTILK